MHGRAEPLVHPVIATRWAGNLGRKSTKLIMIMVGRSSAIRTDIECANTGYHPEPDKVSFSCRIASGLRSLPEGSRREASPRARSDILSGFDIASARIRFRYSRFRQ
jgi:hypothetical protein